jgi:transposase
MTKRTKASAKKPVATTATSLPTVQAMVAGIDIGSSQHWVCGPVRDAEGKPVIRSFGTTTVDLEALVDWLVAQGPSPPRWRARPCTGSRCTSCSKRGASRPVLVNARQLHNVPGRKTDVSDCQWLQLLHSCGLLRGSFRPSETISRLRALQRQMGNLVAERSRCVQWMQKSLDQMNVQVHRAVTDITGKTGMAIVRAIVAGERDPGRLAVHRDGRCRKSPEEIAKCLTGHWREDHLFNLASALRIYDVLEEQIAAYDARLMQAIEALQPPERQDQPVPRHPNAGKEKAIKARGDQPGRLTLWRFAGVDLTRIDGISAGTAQIVLTEIGSSVASFPSEDHFASWLRLCPRTPDLGWQAPEEATQRSRCQPHCGSAPHGRHLASAEQDRPWRCVSPHRTSQGRRGRRLRHRAQAVAAHLPHAAVRPRLRRHRREGVRGPIRGSPAASPPSRRLPVASDTPSSRSRSQMGKFQVSTTATHRRSYPQFSVL